MSNRAGAKSTSKSSPSSGWMSLIGFIFVLALVGYAYYDCRLQKFMGAEFRSECSRPNTSAPVALPPPPQASTRPQLSQTGSPVWAIPPEAKFIFVFFQDPSRLSEKLGCMERAKLGRDEFVQQFSALRLEALGQGRKMIITATPDMRDWVSVPEKIRLNGQPLTGAAQYSCNGPDLTGYDIPL